MKSIGGMLVLASLFVLVPCMAIAANPYEVPFASWKVVDKAFPSDIKSDGMVLKTYGNVAWEAIDKDISGYKLQVELGQVSDSIDFGFSLKIIYDDWMEETLDGVVPKKSKTADLALTPKQWQGRRVRKLTLGHGHSGWTIKIKRFIVMEEQGTSVFISGSSLGGVTLNPGKNLINNILLLKMHDPDQNRPFLTGFKGGQMTLVAAHTGDPRYGQTVDLDMLDSKGNLTKRVSVKVDNQVKEINVPLSGIDFTKVERIRFSNTANIHASVRKINLVQATTGTPPASPCANIKPLNDRLQDAINQASGLNAELKQKFNELLIEYRMKE